MKILVTGAAGFIGSHVAERFAGDGHEVIGLDYLTDYYDVRLKEQNVKDIQQAGVEFHKLDLVTDELTDVCTDVDFCIHLAAQPGISRHVSSELYIRNNVIATERLVQQMEQVDSLQGFINIGTSSIYGRNATVAEDVAPEPISTYGVTKLAAEQLVMARHRENGFPACSLRLFSVYGPRERPEKLLPRLITALLTDQSFPLYNGSENHIRSFTYIDDIVDGIVKSVDRISECEGEIINIGTSLAYTTQQVIDTVEDTLIKSTVITYRPGRPGDQERTLAVIDKSKRLLDYNPSTTLSIGINSELQWFQSNLRTEVV